MGDYTLLDTLCLEAGDFVIDKTNNEVGLLMKRINLINGDGDLALYGWDIMWSGSRYIMNGNIRRSPYTEVSLKNMIIEGLFVLYKNN